MKQTDASLVESSHGYYSCNRPEIQKLVRQNAKRILDIGCAAGMLGYELKQRLGAEVWGVEYVASVAEEAAARLDRVISGAIEENLTQIPDRYFDTIICADVLEHLIDPWQLLTNLASKLTADGEIVASIPNVRHWQVIRTLLEGSWRYEDAGILDRTHLRFFTKRDAVSLFESSGYEIVNGEAISYEGDTPSPDAVVKALKSAGLAVDTLTEESRHYQYLLVARPVNTTMAAIEPPEPASYQDITSIIILTWNQLPLTQACFTSIAAHTPEPYELIVVDNGSSDGTVEWLKKQAATDTRIRLIENSINKGFAAGCNQGIRAARGEYLLLLNNDTVVTPGWLSGLHEVLARYSDTGIVGPMTNSASGIQVVADTGYASLSELPAWSAAFRENNRYRIIPQRRIVGFCMLFRQELIKKTGLLDESFGSGNYEDDDLCLRAELAGYRNLIAGDVFIHHEGGATFSGNCLDRGEKNRANRIIFKQKWDPSRLEETVLRNWLVLNAIEDAKAQSQRGDIDGAVQTLLNQGIKIAPDSPVPYLELAEILMAAGRHEEALQVLPEMPASTDQALKFEIEAICHAALGDDQAADRAAKNASGRPRVLVVLGTLAARQGDLQHAETLFRQAIAADPSCGNGWLSLGMLLWSLGKSDDAWQAVKRSVTVDPLNDEAVRIMRDMAERFG
jgi:GT2 family glycosyltransferase/predicted TPR repeat methyltransferase